MTLPQFKKVLVKTKSIKSFESCYIFTYNSRFWYTDKELKCYFCGKLVNYPHALQIIEGNDGVGIVACYSEDCLMSGRVWGSKKDTTSYSVKCFEDV